MTRTAVERHANDLVSRVSPFAVGVGLLAVLAETALLAGYFGLTGAEPRSLRYLAYPFVWINLGLWAVFRVEPPSASRWVRRGVSVVAAAYLFVLLYAGGVLDLAHIGHFHSHGDPNGFSIFTALPPGWGPTVVYEHAMFTLTLIPYQLVGYLALTYLAYVAVLDATATALSGAVGLLSCVSCSWPVFASLVAGIGGGPVVSSAVYSFSLDFSTLAFVVAVALLLWRPGSD
jgi:hypothetical protein